LRESQKELTKLLDEQEELMNTIEKIEDRLQIMRQRQLYPLGAIRKQKAKLSQHTRKLKKYGNRTKIILTLIENYGRQIRTLSEINFNYFDDNVNDDDEIQ